MQGFLVSVLFRWIFLEVSSECPNHFSNDFHIVSWIDWFEIIVCWLQIFSSLRIFREILDGKCVHAINNCNDNVSFHRIFHRLVDDHHIAIHDPRVFHTVSLHLYEKCWLRLSDEKSLDIDLSLYLIGRCGRHTCLHIWVKRQRTKLIGRDIIIAQFLDIPLFLQTFHK